jgi:hypothetical protein
MRKEKRFRDNGVVVVVAVVVVGGVAKAGLS